MKQILMMFPMRQTFVLLCMAILRSEGFKLENIIDTTTEVTEVSDIGTEKQEGTTTSIVNFGGGIVFENGVLKRYTTTHAPYTETEASTTEMMNEISTKIANTDAVMTTVHKSASEETTSSVDEDLTVTEIVKTTANKDDDTPVVFGTNQDAVNFDNIVSQLVTEAGTTTLDTSTVFPVGDHDDDDHTNKTEILVDQYHNQTKLVSFLSTLESSYPSLVTPYTIGLSIEGRDLLAVKITSAAGKAGRPLGVPMVKYVANMHGDESVGREMLIALAEYLVINYGVIEKVTKLIDTTEIHLVPSMNPDGFERVTRGNFNGVDLNREFPGQESLSVEREELFEDREKEVVSVMKWILDNPFVTSINFHDGAVVANYPYDEKSLQPWTKSNLFKAHHQGDEEKLKLTPDNEEFLQMARLYSDNHKTMHNGNHSCQKFDRGITNGADWYEISGGMQDFNYLYTNCMEITLELSCIKKPKASMLQGEWEKNREALLAFLETARGAAHGIVTDAQGSPVEGARVEVIGKAKDVLTTDRGEYWRVLAPGKHRIKASLGDLESDEVDIEISDDWTEDVGPVVDLQIKRSVFKTVATTTTSTTSTTTTTTTTTEEPTQQGTNLYLLPGVCINLSFSGVSGCKERRG